MSQAKEEEPGQGETLKHLLYVNRARGLYCEVLSPRL